MPTIETLEKQTLINLSNQLYGNADAFMLLIADNYGTLRTSNDPTGAEIDLAYPLVAGQTVVYQEDHELSDKAALRALNGATIATASEP